MKNKLWSTTAEMYIKVVELAKEHGKKPGASMEEEFKEIREKYPDQFTMIGETEKDMDVLTGDLREDGYRVLNIQEEERKRELAQCTKHDYDVTGHCMYCGAEEQ